MYQVQKGKAILVSNKFELLSQPEEVPPQPDPSLLPIHPPSITLDKSIPAIIHLESQTQLDESFPEPIPDPPSSQVNPIPLKSFPFFFSDSQLDSLVSPSLEPSLGNPKD